MVKKQSKKINRPIEEYYKIWQEYLVKPEGVSYKEINLAYAKEFKEEMEDYEELSRQHKKFIKLLLKENGINLIELKDARPTRFRVEEESIDLVKLSQDQKVAQPYVAIIDMLSKCKGMLPEFFLQSLCEKYQKMSKNVNVNKSIAFETNYDYMAELDLFPVIYNALNTHVIWVSFHPVNKPDESVNGNFSPEYLKQYQSNWYAFGMFEEEGKPAVFQKIPLNNVDNFDEDPVSTKFVKSDIEDYEEYFDDIIGVENPDSNEIETIKFRISNRMFQRIKDKPLHPSQTPCKELNINGFKGLKIDVKYNIELMRTILKLGADIEIVEPAHIRKRVIKNLQKALKLYDK